MKKSIFNLFFALIIILLFAVNFAKAEERATGALSFLRLGTGARAIALGKAFTSIANDASAIYWNPAGLAQLKNFDFYLTNRIQQDKDFGTSLFSIAGAVPISEKYGTIGAAVFNYSVGDILNFNEYADFLGKFDFTERAIIVSYGHSVGPLNFGISGKYLSQKTSGLDFVNQSGQGIDISFLYAIHRKWNLGVILRDNAKIGKSDEVPLGAQIGVSRVFDLGGMLRTIRLMSDLEAVKYTPLRLHFGGEADFYLNENFDLTFRAGLSNFYLESRTERVEGGILRTNSRKFSFGIGFKIKLMQDKAIYIDYAFVSEELDDTGFVTIGVNF